MVTEYRKPPIVKRKKKLTTEVSAYSADIKSGSGTFLIQEVFSIKRPQREETYQDALRTSDRERREEGGGQAVHVLRRNEIHYGRTARETAKKRKKKRRARKRRGCEVAKGKRRRQRGRGGSIICSLKQCYQLENWRTS